MLPAWPSDGVDAAGDHVVDGAGIDVDAVEQSAPRRGAQVDRMHAGERTVSLADGGAHSVDDVCLAVMSVSFFRDAAENDGEVLPADLLRP